ncbi:mitofissin [Trichomonascus vanleenenianus]|uniref:mitofissin n=1 Tax=Trichomonascus vanleenenianus TaxID=2268995 RepID=UPI003EC9B705
MMGTLGRLAHISFDLVLVSAIMAGVKRSTGLTLKTSDIESKDVKGFVDRYLDVGEWVFDTSIAFMGNSNYFERKR